MTKVFPKLLSQAELEPTNILGEHFRVPASMQRPEGDTQGSEETGEQVMTRPYYCQEKPWMRQ